MVRFKRLIAHHMKDLHQYADSYSLLVGRESRPQSATM